MLAGMTIDTRKWRERTGVRTYDAASALRKLWCRSSSSVRLLERYL